MGVWAGRNRSSEGRICEPGSATEAIEYFGRYQACRFAQVLWRDRLERPQKGPVAAGKTCTFQAHRSCSRRICFALPQIPAFAESVSLYRHIRPSRRDAPFPRRVQYLIPAIRSGFFRVHPESLVQERLSPFIMTIWQTKTLAGQSVMNG